MKSVCKILFLTLCTVLVAGLMISGCRSADNGNSQTAEFPTIERWWK